MLCFATYVGSNDFISLNEDLAQFATATRRRCVTVQIVNDILYEVNEEFSVSLTLSSASSQASVRIEQPVATVRILDEDGKKLCS